MEMAGAKELMGGNYTNRLPLSRCPQLTRGWTNPDCSPIYWWTLACVDDKSYWHERSLCRSPSNASVRPGFFSVAFARFHHPHRWDGLETRLFFVRPCCWHIVRDGSVTANAESRSSPEHFPRLRLVAEPGLADYISLPHTLS